MLLRLCIHGCRGTCWSANSSCGPRPWWGKGVFLPAAINGQQFLNEDGASWSPAPTMLGLCLSWESCACSCSYCQFICATARCMQKTWLHYRHPLSLALMIFLLPPLRQPLSLEVRGRDIKVTFRAKQTSVGLCDNYSLLRKEASLMRTE